MKTPGPHGALIYAMLLVSASDGTTSAREMKTIHALVKSLPVFGEFEAHELEAVMRDFEALFEAEGGEGVLDRIIRGLPSHLRETAYWLALEVTLSDARVMLEEIRALEILRRALGIDRLNAAALERGARARHQIA
jgi:tellurite resistance protein